MHLARLLLVLLLAVPAHAAWQLDRFMISAWGAPTDEATAAAYAGAGFNTVMAKSDVLDLCAKHRLRAIVMDATPEMAEKLRSHPGVWGWYVQDEPKAEEFQKAGERVAPFHAADPDHPAYVNLMAWMNLDDYLSTVKPRFLSYDYYQWWWGPRNYCNRLEAHRTAALKAGLPLICWVEANADPRYEWGKPGAGYLPDNAAKLRQSVSLAVVYGVQGIQWFTGGLCFDKDGKLTESGRDIAVINHELQALGPTLLTLRSEAVYHTAPVPSGSNAVPADLWVQSPYRDVTFGLFRDAKARRHLIVVNRAIDRERAISLHVSPDASQLELFDVSTQKWLPLKADAIGEKRIIRLNLAPGALAMLRTK